MPALRHPYSRCVYDITQDGLVEVTTPDGSTGVFSPTGEWHSGTVRECDPLFAQWVAGPQVAHHRLSKPTTGDSDTHE